ncbi:hypothetical protein [Adhaeribacter terreus]|uniref:Uncharacterized protein n=1 Tax=Adhaeribacter terreus TaxID=529703 RepID=A0ABW0EBA2_9BACT
MASYSKNSSAENAVSEAIAETQADLIQGIISDSILNSISVDETAGSFSEDEPTDEENSLKETRLKYPAFEVVIHNFKGYEPALNETHNGDRKYYSQFGGSSDYNEAELNDAEQENEDYTEALIVKKDTLHISEQLFDDRINNTLIQILPKNKNDRFKLSFCYLSTLGEIIDDRKMTREEANKRYKKAARYDEQTQYYSIKDSASFYFRAMPHTPDMEEITVKDGKIVPVKKPNTKRRSIGKRNSCRKSLPELRKSTS